MNTRFSVCGVLALSSPCLSLSLGSAVPCPEHQFALLTLGVFDGERVSPSEGCSLIQNTSETAHCTLHSRQQKPPFGLL